MPGDIDEGHHRDVETVAKSDEPGSFDRTVDVEYTGVVGWLIGDDTHASAVVAAESNDDVGGEFFLDLEEITIVDRGQDDVLHIVGFVGIGRDDGVELFGAALRRVRAGLHGRIFHIVLRQKGDQLPNIGDGIGSSFGGEIGNSAARGMHVSATQFLYRNVFMGDRLDHFGTGQKHIGVVLHHDHEIGQRR